VKILLPVMVMIGAAVASAQDPPDAFQPRATTRQLMVDAIYPASNDILLAVFRGAPVSDQEWAAVRRSALTLAESGNLLMIRDRARDQGEWRAGAAKMSDLGSAAYAAAQAKDLKALGALAAPLDASCTACHMRYRPNVFPRDGGSR